MKISIFNNKELLIKYLDSNYETIKLLNFENSENLENIVSNKILYPYNYTEQEKQNLIDEYIEVISDLGGINKYSLYWICHPISEKNDLLPNNLLSQLVDFF